MILYNPDLDEIHLVKGCFPLFNDGNEIEWRMDMPAGSPWRIDQTLSDWVFIGFL